MQEESAAFTVIPTDELIVAVVVEVTAIVTT